MKDNGLNPVSKMGEVQHADANTNGKTNFKAGMKNIYHLAAFDPDGNLKWEETIENVVTDAGLNNLLDEFFKGSSYTAAWYVLLTDGTPTVAAANTLASHAGWVEVTDYAGDRKALTLGTVASKSVDNSASKATFVIDADDTVIGGAGLASVATGTSGVLYSVAAFTAADKQLDDGDTLNVTVTVTAASA